MFLGSTPEKRQREQCDCGAQFLDKSCCYCVGPLPEVNLVRPLALEAKYSKAVTEWVENDGDGQLLGHGCNMEG